MKLAALEKHLRKYGCAKKREGGNHTVWENKENRKISAVPRHREIKDLLAQKICKQLEIPIC
jgi:mRNA interferase HicA